MAWKATTEEAATVIPEGEYDAEITSVQDMEGQHGPMVRIEFTLTTADEWDGRRVSGLASKKLSDATKLGRWVASIIGHMPEVGEEITIDDLLYKQCRVLIRHKASPDGKTFANVAEVFPLSALI